MKRLDLIIEFCESMANMHVKGSVHALAAARELREMKPVAWLVSDAQGRYATIRDPSLYAEEVYEPLYALGDEK